MGKLNKLLLLGLVGLGLTKASSYGSTFDYSFVFPSGPTVSGTLDGTLDTTGVYVENVSDITMLFNGTPVSGPFDAFHTDSLNNTVAGTPVVSFDVLDNNFLFRSTTSPGYRLDLANYGGNGTHFAYLVWPGSYAWQFAPGGTWTLTEEKSVPDGGLTIAMLGMGIFGLAFIRRKV